MAEQLVREPLYVQKDSEGRYRVEVPKRGVADRLELRKHHPVRVFVDVSARRIIYELVEP